MNRRIRELRLRISELERQLSQQESNARRLNGQMRNELLRAINEQSQQMSSEIQHIREAQTEYINRAINELVELHNESILRMRREYDRLQNSITVLRQQHSEYMQELNRALGELKNSIESEKSFEREAASREVVELNKTVQRVRKLPHEFFAPGKLSVYSEEAVLASELIERNMYQAAVAAAIGADTALRCIENDIYHGLNEWTSLFNRYEQLLVINENFVKKEEARCLDERADLRDDAVLDFWSEGAFGEHMEELGKYRLRANEIRAIGVEKYLKEHQGFTMEVMKREIDSMLVATYKFSLLMLFAASSLIASADREQFLDSFSEYMRNELCMEETDFGYEELEGEICNGFKEAIKKHGGLGRECREDLREAIHLYLRHYAAEYHLMAIPVKNKKTVENKLYIHINNPNRANACAAAAEKKEIEDIIVSLCNKLKIRFLDIEYVVSEQLMSNHCAEQKTHFKVDLDEAERNAILRRTGR